MSRGPYCAVSCWGRDGVLASSHVPCFAWRLARSGHSTDVDWTQPNFV